jgi:hypothetical protein
MSEPLPDDVVVRERRSNPHTLYAVGTLASPDQFVLATREHALEQAKRYARRARVRAWFEQRDGTFALLNDSTK